MTREEFIKKNAKEILATMDQKILKLMCETGTLVGANEKIMESSGENGNGFVIVPVSGVVSYCVKEGDSIKKGDVLATLCDGRSLKIFDENGDEYSKTVDEHRKFGDLIQYCYSVRDKNLSDWIKLKLFITKEEFQEYSQGVENHIKELYETHSKDGTLETWLEELKKNDLIRYKKIGSLFLKDRYAKEIAEHREKGDLIDYVWELSDELKLNYAPFSQESISMEDEKKFKEYYPFELLVLRSAFTSKDKEEIRFFFGEIVSRIGESYEVSLVLGWKVNDAPKYISKLYQSPKDSIEYKRYEKIRSKLSISTLEKLDEELKNRDKNKKQLKIIIPAAAIIFVGLIIVVIAVI